jgi:tRNA(fMet)-specific endonuclease VapC
MKQTSPHLSPREDSKLAGFGQLRASGNWWRSFCCGVGVLPWDSDAAEDYAEIRAQVAGPGAPMGNMDLMIAAQALAEQATLVISDRSFQRIKQLKIED